MGFFCGRFRKEFCGWNNSGNLNGGNYPKKIQTEHGESVISISHDRNDQFKPIALSKHESRGLSIEELVSSYMQKMSISDIAEEVCEIYEFEFSASDICIITNKVSQVAQEWQNRILYSVYLCVGLKMNGLKEGLGMWIGKSRRSSFRVCVMTDLKVCGA